MTPVKRHTGHVGSTLLAIPGTAGAAAPPLRTPVLGLAVSRAGAASSRLWSRRAPAGVGAMCLRTAVMGAVLNARINCGDLEDQAKVAEVQNICAQLVASAQSQEASILRAVDEVMAR